MNKFEKFSIILNSSSCIYNAGEKITGSVILVLKKSIKLRGISVKLIGKGEVNWEEDGPGIGYNPTYYSSHETYIDSTIILYGKASHTSEQIELLEGEHKFPFKFHLPLHSPSSFEHKYGHINYFVKAVIDKPWTLDRKCKIPIQVKSVIDLKTQAEVKLPIQKKVFTKFGFISCSSGMLSATIHLKQTGFVPGEKICINAEINNESNKTVAYSQATLKMEIKFRTSSKNKTKKMSLVSIRGGSIKPGSTGTWNGKVLEVPPLATPQMLYCSIIDIDYTLKFSVCSTWCTLLDIPIKIIIGTVPLRK
ncbi:unnamed protein product [Acanthosepion pharaonis]|uniref:Arrestin C-terminal-like domain-containing protein n=1 Tax=Acanthosepion pharaonis TaxID=158019 RepID=A0A812B9I6_ACAPH|nr:unnamed protein product [Sepia pharaonis]